MVSLRDTNFKSIESDNEIFGHETHHTVLHKLILTCKRARHQTLSGPDLNSQTASDIKSIVG